MVEYLTIESNSGYKLSALKKENIYEMPSLLKYDEEGKLLVEIDNEDFFEINLLPALKNYSNKKLLAWLEEMELENILLEERDELIKLIERGIQLKMFNSDDLNKLTKNNTIPTAEAFYEYYKNEKGNFLITDLLIDFAKLHVEACKEEISNNIEGDFQPMGWLAEHHANTEFIEGIDYEIAIPKQRVLELYPLKKIK